MRTFEILRYQYGAIEIPHPYIPNERIPATSEFITKLVDDVITRTLSVTQAKDYRLFLTGPNNFRFDIAKEAPYKGNRKDSVKPEHWSTIGRHLVAKYGRRVILTDGNEADDAMAMHRFKEDEYEYIICSRDKDLETVPGWHYRWACGDKQPEKLPYHMTVFESNRFFLYQMMIGDTTDNIIGCGRKKLTWWGAKPAMKRLGWPKRVIKHILDLPGWEWCLASVGVEQVSRRDGIGPKEAEAILDDCSTLGEMISEIEQHYLLKFEDEAPEKLLENARLLYMGQTPDSLFEWDWMDSILNYSKDTENEQVRPEESKSGRPDGDRVW